MEPSSTASSVHVATRRREGVRRGSALVIGGLVLDIQARPGALADVQSGTSVPGQVSRVPGGVARNIAEGLAGLLPSNRAPVLLGVVGKDSAGETLLQHCRACGVCTDTVLQCKDVVTPTVVAVFDRHGEVAACVASVAAVESHVTPELLQEKSAYIHAAELVVLDANLTAEATLAACKLAASAGVPVFLEPVSVPKAIRSVPSLSLLDYISPNMDELIALATACRAVRGLPPLPLPVIASQQKPLAQLKRLAPFVTELLEVGTKHVVLTMGEIGAAVLTYAPDSQRKYIHATVMPAQPCKVVSLSGAGDSLVAGMIAALLQGSSPAMALAQGMAVAAFTVESAGNVAVGISRAMLEQRIQRLLSSATTATLPTSLQAHL